MHFRPDAVTARGTTPEVQVTRATRRHADAQRTAAGAGVALRRFAVTFPGSRPLGSRPAARRCCGPARTAPRNRGTSACSGGRRQRVRPAGRRLMRRAIARRRSVGACSPAPTVLAFYSGGYFAEPRIVAAIVAWTLVLALAAVGPAPLPRGRAGRVALAGLALLTAWSALSLTWAPLGGPAIQSVVRLVLYTGVLLLAIGVLSVPRAAARRRARAGRGDDRGHRLRARRPAPPGHCGPRSLARRGRAARAADHLLERRGRTGRHGPRAVRPPGGRPLAPGRDPRRGRRRGGAARRRRLPVLLARGDRGRPRRPGRARRGRPLAHPVAGGRCHAGRSRPRRRRRRPPSPAWRRSRARSPTARGTARSPSRSWSRSPRPRAS